MTLNEIFPAWMDDGGIFSAFEETGAAPWRAADIPADILNLEYHGNHSGGKTISPALMAVTGGEELSRAGRLRLAANLIARYGVKWEKLWDTLSLEYNPIENYSMVEIMTNDRTVDAYGKESTRTDNLSHGKTGTETQSPNLTERETPDTTETETPNTTEQETPNTTETETPNTVETETPNTTETNAINKSNTTHNTTHGFNTSAGVPSDDTEETEQGTESKTYSGNIEKRTSGSIQRTRAGTVTHTKTGNVKKTVTGTVTNTRTGTDQTTYNTTETDTGTQKTTDAGQDTHTRNYNLTRSGNIGVTTSQQMLQSERDLWQLWDYFRETVFPDLDSFLTIPIY